MDRNKGHIKINSAISFFKLKNINMLSFGKFKNKIIKFEKFSSTEKEKSRCFLRAL